MTATPRKADAKGTISRKGIAAPERTHASGRAGRNGSRNRNERRARLCRSMKRVTGMMRLNAEAALSLSMLRLARRPGSHMLFRPMRLWPAIRTMMMPKSEESPGTPPSGDTTSSAGMISSGTNEAWPKPAPYHRLKPDHLASGSGPAGRYSSVGAVGFLWFSLRSRCPRCVGISLDQRPDACVVPLRSSFVHPLGCTKDDAVALTCSSGGCCEDGLNAPCDSDKRHQRQKCKQTVSGEHRKRDQRDRQTSDR